MVAWLTSQTDRYRCAIAHAAVTVVAGHVRQRHHLGQGVRYGAEVWEDLARVNRWSRPPTPPDTPPHSRDPWRARLSRARHPGTGVVRRPAGERRRLAPRLLPGREPLDPLARRTRSTGTARWRRGWSAISDDDVLVVTGGDPVPPSALEDLDRRGLRRRGRLGSRPRRASRSRPDVVVGDFDSVSDEPRAIRRRPRAPSRGQGRHRPGTGARRSGSQDPTGSWSSAATAETGSLPGQRPGPHHRADCIVEVEWRAGSATIHVVHGGRLTGTRARRSRSSRWAGRARCHDRGPAVAADGRHPDLGEHSE
jgi:hypothetical protein